MWTKPWTFKEGFLIGGGLIFAGLMLEYSIFLDEWTLNLWDGDFATLDKP